MPYFLSKLTVLAPASERPPRSESDFLLLAVDRADDFRASLGPLLSKSLRLNLPVSECTEGGPLREDRSSPPERVGNIRGAVGGGGSFLWGGFEGCVAGGTSFPPETPADMLGARLGGWVDGTLQLSHSDGEGDPLDGGVMEPVVEDESCLPWVPPLRSRLLSLLWMC